MQEFERGHTRTGDPRDTPDHVESCSVCKAEGGRREEDVQSDGVCLPKYLLKVMEPCFPGEG